MKETSNIINEKEIINIPKDIHVIIKLIINLQI